MSVQPVDTYWVAGEWHPADGAAYSRPAPVEGTALPGVRLAGATLMDRALDAAVTALPAAEALSVAERQAALSALSHALTADAGALAAQVTVEVGCPSAQAEALQVSSAAGVLSAYAAMLDTHVFEERRAGLRGGAVLIRKSPVGVAAGIVPWNVPLFLAAVKLGAAIAAGCPIVLKPSPENAASMHRFAAHVAGLPLPPGMVSVLTGDRDFGAALVADSRVAKVSFTGSTAAGRHVARTCVDRFARCTLELGGKSAAILLDDIDLDAVWGELFLATLQNNGQVCGAQSRLFLPRSRFAELSEDLAARFRALTIGDPRDAATHIGPVASPIQQDRIMAALHGAEADGARALAGGSQADEPGGGCFIAPTLYTGVDDGMAIAREEVFGPVIVALPYDSEDDALARANASSYGLSGSVWSADTDRALRLAKGMRTGTVGLSTKRILDFGSPFGGMRASGLGREMGPEGIDAYLETTAILAPRGFEVASGGAQDE